MKCKKNLLFCFLIVFMITTLSGCSGENSIGNLLDKTIGKIVELLLGSPPAEDLPSVDEEIVAEESDDVMEGDLEADSTLIEDSSEDDLAGQDTSLAVISETISVTEDDQSLDADLVDADQSLDADLVEESGTNEAEDPTTIPESESDTGEEPSSLENGYDAQTSVESGEVTSGEEIPISPAEVLESFERSKNDKEKRDYRTFRNPFDLDPNDIIEPPPPPKPEFELDPIELGDIELNGIMWNDVKRQALITGEDGKGYFITIGDKIKGATVEDIQPDRVIFVQRFMNQVQRAELTLEREKD